MAITSLQQHIITDIYSEINTAEWEQLIQESSTATFFQTPECYAFYASLSFMHPFVYAVSENGQLKGVVLGYVVAEGGKLKQFFSRRAIVPGGALLADDISDEALSALLKEVARSLSRKAIYIELRNYNSYEPYKKLFEENGFRYQPHLNFHVSTPDVETAMAQLSSSKRRQVRLTVKASVEIEKATTSTEVQAYYLILEELYRTRVKSPLFPFEFFEKLIELPSADILLVKKKGEVLGGITCVYFEGKTVSEWFVCGHDSVAEKNVFPSVLATWAGIEYAAQNGFEKFDFMGAGKPDEGYGVREFKSKFGGELVEYGRFLCVGQPLLYQLGKYVVKKIKALK